jgi:hypothetical protein
MRGKRTSGRLAPPFFLRGRRGWGDEGQTRSKIQKTAHFSQELSPLSALSSPHAGQGDTLDEETL